MDPDQHNLEHPGQHDLEPAGDANDLPSAERLDALHARLAAAAVAEGLIDVGFGAVDTPLGELLLAATPVGIVRVGFQGEGEECVLEELATRVSSRVLRAPALVEDARRQISDYFDGRRRAFELALDWRLTRGFRRRVLEMTAQIPYGRTQSYRQVATQIGDPAAVRAAGTALATNPLPVIVPCHRVLRSDGALGGYRGGVDAKRRLLALEGQYA